MWKVMTVMSEKTLTDAPVQYSGQEAEAWAAGYNAANEELRNHLTAGIYLIKFARDRIKDKAWTTALNSIVDYFISVKNLGIQESITNDSKTD